MNYLERYYNTLKCCGYFFYHKFRNVSWYVIRNMYIMTNQPYTVLIEIIIFIFVWSKENSEAVIETIEFYWK